MRLLLTSDGLTTDAIASELELLLGEQHNRKVAFIITAALAEPGHKNWLLQQIGNIQRFGYGLDYIDIVDPGAPGIDWRARLEPAGIIFVAGGDAEYLLLRLKAVGCDTWLYKKLQADKIVYVGASAGSMITGPTLDGLKLYLPETPLHTKGMHWVDFEILPHAYKDVSAGAIKSYSTGCSHKVFPLQDTQAVLVAGNDARVIP